MERIAGDYTLRIDEVRPDTSEHSRGRISGDRLKDSVNRPPRMKGTVGRSSPGTTRDPAKDTMMPFGAKKEEK